MIVFEAKLKGTDGQYKALDEALRTARFVRNSCLRYWMDNKGVNRYDLNKYCKVLADNVDFPGVKNLNSMVRNHHLAKSISDAAWSQFREWVEYFGKIFEVPVIAVAPHYTSQNCSKCGVIVKKTLSTRTHKCTSCNHIQDRDWNAAVNILKKALQQLSKNTAGHAEINNVSGENDHYLEEETQPSKPTRGKRKPKQ